MNGVLVADRYRLDHRIGAGGMGYVWLAWDEVLRRHVAVKEVHLPAGLSDTEVSELRARTLREAQAAARLSHPNVVRTYDVLRTESRPYIVMEYVQSRSLAEVIKADGPLSPDRVARVGLALLAALKAAHDAGVLHRDIKPGNVLLGTDGRVMLTDFGLAVFDDVGMHLTHPGVVHGSPQFIAPERAKDGTSTAASDLWSLGATLYAAVEGQSPYERSTSYATLAALATEAPAPPQHAGPLKPVLNGLLRREPSARMPIEEATARLQMVLSDSGSLPAAPAHIPRQVVHEESERVDSATTSEPSANQPQTPGSVARNRSAFSDDTAQRRRVPRPRSAPAASASSGEPAEDERWDLGYTDRGIERRRRQMRLVSGIVAGVAVVVLALAAGYLLAPHGHATANANAPTPNHAPPGGGPRPGDGPLGPPPLRWPCTPTVSTPVTPFTTVAPRKQLQYGLIPGFGWFDDSGGFQIAAPTRFEVARNSDTLCMYDPSEARVLGVHRFAYQTKNPLTALKSQLTTLIDNGAYPGYNLESINAVPLQPTQAEAIFTYTGPRGPQRTAMHEFIDGHSAAYAVTWDTPAVYWTEGYPTWNLIEASFLTN